MENQIARNLTDRMPTGIQGLDTILRGGLLRAGVYVVVGPPGAGKTILGNHISFDHVKRGGKALYITLLAESHDRMLAYIQRMNFFNAEVIPSGIHYISGYPMLEEGGLKALLETITHEVLSRKATLLVLDGFIIKSEFGESELSVKRMIHELQAFTAMVGCTVLMLTIANDSEGQTHPGYTMVDGVIELTDTNVGPRAIRELQVKKIRGTHFLRGKHTFDITNEGMIVFPRTEVLLANPPAVAAENRTREAFGIEVFDDMLGGGLLSGSMTTILGAPGTGKTLLGLSFLRDGANRQQHCIYFGFYEPPQRLIEKSRQVNIDIGDHVKTGMIDLVWQPPLEHLLDGLAERLLTAIREKKARRVFIDGLEGFKTATVYPERIGAFLAALTNELRAMDVTVIFSEETELYKPGVEMPVKELAAVIENVIFLRHLEQRSHLHRIISILKVRESAYDSSIRQFFITDRGISIDKSVESAESILMGKG